MDLKFFEWSENLTLSISNLKMHPSDSWFLRSWKLPHTILNNPGFGMRDGSLVHCWLSDGSIN